LLLGSELVPGEPVYRPEHGQAYRSGDPAPTRAHHGHRYPRTGGGRGDELVAVCRLGQLGGHHGADPASVEDPGHSPGVVDVEMADHQQRYGLHAQVAQAPVDGTGIRAGVHDDRAARPDRYCDRVALTDVAHHGERPGRRPTRRGHLDRYGTECGGDRAHSHHDPDPGPPPGPPREPEQRGQQQRPAGTAGPAEDAVGSPGT
jgi:hypothetical protein